MKAVSLFTGAGGMDVGFSKAGVSVIWANELDEDAAATYQKNNPETTLRQGDIKKAKSELSRLIKVDMIFGGPPCQGFSVAGKMDPNDERSKLIWEYLDVVDILKPKVFIMENVKALGELQKWQAVRERIIDTALSIGYSCFSKVLNAADFGVPQKRERVFFIGFLNAENNVEALFEKQIALKEQPRVSLRDCLLKLPAAGTEGNPITCTAKISLASSPILRKSPYAGMLFNGLGRPLDLDNQANTLPASMGGNKTPILDEQLLYDPAAFNWVINYHGGLSDDKNHKPVSVPEHMRRITTVEAAAIQTFPADYEFIGEKSSIYRQIGNAVPCDLAAAVAKAVIEVFNMIYPQQISA
ncbi:MAG: DNA cytosine methyltransferase [Bacteroidales bacterium]|nr:DNA cytosine methyltransferase [Bacteroidales bacterium]